MAVPGSSNMIITSGACPFMERSYGLESRTVELTQAFIKAMSAK
jgi:hypothetical protein